MQRVRVLVANQPRLMRELVVETISDQSDIDIVGEIHEDSQLLQAIEQTHPDVLIVGLDRSAVRPAICDVALERHPQLRILALAPERNLGLSFWASFDIHSSRVETSEEGLLNYIRSRPQPVGENE